MHLVQVAGFKYNIEGSNHPFHFLIPSFFVFLVTIFSSEVIRNLSVARVESQKFVFKLKKLPTKLVDSY